ncbi:MAG: hypothetical protein VYE68_16400 [Acidobacteriota bacterium]|nr:hypothetical protein [Acidobacteriota bacterium]
MGLAMALGLVVACERFENRSPISPTDVRADPGLGIEVLAQWSPYVGIHVAGQALETYREAVSILRAAGRLKGVRIEITRGLSPGDPTLRAITATGVEVLGLISNEILRLPNIEDEIDHIFRAYPQIRHFQVGNEVTTNQGGTTITIQQYMTIFQRVYDHMLSSDPGRAILLTQSTLGSGLHGPTELEAMGHLGLSGLDPRHVIVAVNMYDLDHASQYLGLLGGALRGFRVWVTESGIRDPERHLSWVRDSYPRLRNLLRAERVYWYVMWGGDSGPDTDFSLVKNPSAYPNYWRSPLFELLASR